ncbi:MAG: galactokinase [Peptostreptococcaceae bacterium]|nr:galactokinase [Peptostreptococcaceae bacterium]
MIYKTGNTFTINTYWSSYVFRIMEAGQLEHIYYGKKVVGNIVANSVLEKHEFPRGSSISYSKEYDNVCLEDICLEYSSTGKGDSRDPLVVCKYADGSTTSDFIYFDYEMESSDEMSTLPSSYGSDKADRLKIVLKERERDVFLELFYTSYPKCDVISRRAKLINKSDEDVVIKRLMSAQLDFDEGDFDFTTFNGAWAREMDKNTISCGPTLIVNSSNAGVSSSGNNPFVMLSDKNTDEDYGKVYGMNLIYSGNHYESVQKNRDGKLRFLSGINPENFSWHLNKDEAFEAPEAVFIFSDKGFKRMSNNMHEFVNEHVVRGPWKYKERPIINNSWEAAYFNFNQSKLLTMAKAAKEVGVELFVLDDGWFGKRDDDKTSLGDWYPNKKKLPKGVKGLADKINDMGLEFGIWVEPEMVNEESDLYKEHPEYAIKNPNRDHSLGRNQMMLDLSNKEVREYVFNAMKNLFSSANISYVKWDMNRIMSDSYSQHLNSDRQEELSHRYVMGLYEILVKLQAEFPNILFEGCASGGNRFDLGILCYMPQIWASDNTDALCRTEIQTGYSYGYPMSTIGAHVSDSPNHQTLRETSIESRFQVACFGILGYELNIAEMSSVDKKIVIEQIKWYKKHRYTMQFGEFYRLKQDNRITSWMSVGIEEAVGLVFQSLVKANFGYQKFVSKGLKEDCYYRFSNRIVDTDIREFGTLINAVSPVHIKNKSAVHNALSKFVKLDGEKEDCFVTGSLLNNIGIKLKPGFSGTGHNENVRIFKDFASRIYVMEEVKRYFAPGRVNLIGEHIDYNGGKVLPCAISLGIYGSFVKRNDDKIHLYSNDFSEFGEIEISLNDLEYNEEDSWTNYVKGVIVTLKKHGYKIDKGFNLYCNSDLPKGAGLSSSACLEMLVAYAINNEYELGIPNEELAVIGKEAENNFIGVQCGIMDQFAIAMGKKDNAIYLDTNNLEYKYVPAIFDDLTLVICNTNKERKLSESKYNQRVEECKEILSYLNKEHDYKNLVDISLKEYEDNKNLIPDETHIRRGRHVVTECERTNKANTALINGDFVEFGKLLNESHKSLKEDYEVTGIELDTIVEAAVSQEGVLGARMTGAGFGGCAIALVRNEELNNFIKSVSEIYKKEIGYTPSFYPVEIVDGPKRIMKEYGKNH